jgi:adenine-specific DNA-methyltransferase
VDPYSTDPDTLRQLSREQLLDLMLRVVEDGYTEGGIRINFEGKATTRTIARKVRPRILRTLRRYGVGDPEQQAQNLVIEGDNLQAMATLYRERGRVDLIVTDPPYNTGKDFRYNDRWDADPNDPGIGELVSVDDAGRHTKWMRFMWPRLAMMRSMLKPGGVLAICIDHREIFRLGQLLNELFGEQNRIGIINWQKTSAPRSDSTHISTSTEYVLVYARDLDQLRSGRLERGEAANRRYGNPDDDPEGDWREGNLTARTYSARSDYGIQSPFTGEVHYPAGNGAWRHTRENLRTWLAGWGSEVSDVDLGDGRAPALMVGRTVGTVPAVVRRRAGKVLRDGPWPFVWFGQDGEGRPRVKTYLSQVRAGAVPVTYWANDPLLPSEIGCVSWGYAQSGRSSDGVAELTAIVGRAHGFDTVKPLRLIEKVIQLWCPPDGIVLDPFAGSGTTGHAVINGNAAGEASRRFILIEQGRPERGDSYARTLLADRLKRVITGDWASGTGLPLSGGFRFAALDKRIDADALLRMERDEMVDTVIASHFDENRRRGGLIDVDRDRYRHLVAKNADGEGFFLIWDGPDRNTNFTVDVYESCAEEALDAKLKPVYHVYARLNLYQTDNVRFYQIPDRILNDFGLDVRSEPFTEVPG